MKKHILFALSLMIVACGGDDGGNSGGETPSKDYLSVTPSLELLAEGQTTDITINANCSWTISKDVDWVTVSPMSGTNTQTVMVSAMKNSTGADRMAILTVIGGSLPARRVTITQRKVEDTPVAYTLVVNTETLSYENTGGTQSFTITSNTNWTISCPDWCSLSTTKGNGNATVSVVVGENTTTAQRSGQIKISGNGVSDVTISVSQKAGEEPSHEPGSGDNLPPN